MTDRPACLRAASPLLILASALTVVATLSLIFQPVFAAEAAVAKSDLFVAGQGGYFNYRVPGIVWTTNGTVLAYAQGNKHNGSDYDATDIVVRRSKDGGITWGPREKLLDSGGGPNMVVDRKQPGVVHFLYSAQDRKLGYDLIHNFYRRSVDNGLTFSSPVEITETLAAFRPEFPFLMAGPTLGHSIQMDNGRLLVSVSLFANRDQFPSAVGTIYSDDSGTTWRRGDIVVRSGDAPNHPMEGVVAQLSDGRVMMNIRNEAGEHRRAVSYSADGATHWTVPKFDPALLEPICFGSLLAVPREVAGAKGMLLFLNPDTTDRTIEIGPKHYCDRKNLTVKLSSNDGADWVTSLVIEPGFSAYSDLCVGPDGTVLCLYERGAGGKDGTNYYVPQAISLARLNIQDIRNPLARAAK
jgi:sialidase-1